MYRFYICDKCHGPRNRISQTFTTKLSVIFNNGLKWNLLVFCNAAEQIFGELYGKIISHLL